MFSPILSVQDLWISPVQRSVSHAFFTGNAQQQNKHDQD
jgi:hypothetical protein